MSGVVNIVTGALINKRRDGQVAGGGGPGAGTAPGSGAVTVEMAKMAALSKYFELMNPGISEYLRCKLSLSSDGGIQAYGNNGLFPPSLFDSIPYATPDTVGVVKVGLNLAIDDNGVLSAPDGGGWVSEKGAANGIAELDAVGKVPSSQLPSYVDDVLEYVNLAAFPATGESGKIYIAIDTNITYRWSGSIYVEISQSIALGETLATAYRGDRGKVAFDHTSLISNPHGVTADQVGLGNVNNTSDAAKPVSTAQQAAIDLKAPISNPVNIGSFGFAATKWRFVENANHLEAKFNGVTKLIFDDDGTVTVIGSLKATGSLIAYTA